MRSIGVVTVGRSDYGIYRPLLEALRARPDVELRVIASGTHLSPRFGETARMIEADGFAIADRVPTLVDGDAPVDIAASMGKAVLGFSAVFARSRPDLLVVLGDRFEMHAAALAALPFTLPVAHIHGGELTAGAFDDALRHSITKLSHLHFVATPEYARRVRQLGEELWRITVSGAPALDNLHRFPLLAADELARRHRLSLAEPPLLVTFHPVTLEYERTAWQVEELLAALADSGHPIVFTAPNADTANRVIREKIDAFAHTIARAQVVETFGPQAYFSLMALAAAMVGNSSSGIIEAASFRLPVVNVGTRQEGRLRPRNVIDVGYARHQVLEGIRRATDRDFRASLEGLVNPYGDGHAVERIVPRLATVSLDERLLVKRFADLCPEDGGIRE